MQGTAPCCVRRGLALNGSLNRTLLSGHTWEQPRSPRGHEQLLKHVCPCRGSGCRKCLVLSLLQEGSRGTASVRWEQVDDLLSLVVELKEEVKRLRSIWDCEREIDWWSHAQPSLQEAHRGDALQAVGDRLLSPSQVGEGELRDSEGWKQVPVWGSEGTASHPVPLSQVPLHNRFKVLELEGLGGVDVGEGPSMQVRLPKASETTSCMTATSVRKKEGL